MLSLRESPGPQKRNSRRPRSRRSRVHGESCRNCDDAATREMEKIGTTQHEDLFMGSGRHAHVHARRYFPLCGSSAMVRACASYSVIAFRPSRERSSCLKLFSVRWRSRFESIANVSCAAINRALGRAAKFKELLFVAANSCHGFWKVVAVPRLGLGDVTFAISRLCSSTPLMPGICTSVIRHSVSDKRPDSRNSSPDAKVAVA
jgi:hypothetical protein